MESPPLRGHPQTPPLHLCSPSWSLLLSPISTPSWPQFSPIGPYSSPGPPPSPGGTSRLLVSRLLTMDLTFIFCFSLYFIFSFSFLFLEQLGLGFISHTVTSVTSWWHNHKTDHGTWEKEVEGSRIKWRHTVWTTHAGLMSYTWSFRVGCTVVSMDHE